MTTTATVLPYSDPRGTFEPCPLDTPCGNCQCPMSGHFRQREHGYGTACSACPCQHWTCRHGGTQTGTH